MTKKKIAGIIIGILLIPIAVGMYNLGLFKLFAPMEQNIKREVFENTKSYIHGVQQDLGKYYLEYQSATEDEKEAIRATIQMRFAEVDANKLQSPQLKNFLIITRGY